MIIKFMKTKEVIPPKSVNVEEGMCVLAEPFPPSCTGVPCRSCVFFTDNINAVLEALREKE